MFHRIYSSNEQGLWSDCAYAQADLSLCWSHIPHCWKSYALAHMSNWAETWWDHWENQCKIMVPLFGAAYAAPNIGTTILYWFRPPKTLLKPLQMVKFKDFSRPLSVFSSTFQDIPFKDFSRQSCIFKYFSSLCKPCTIFSTKYLINVQGLHWCRWYKIVIP